MNADLTTADIARRLNCAPITVLRLRKQLGLGIALKGRAGYRFTEGDWARFQAALRPAVAVKRERKRKTA